MQNNNNNNNNNAAEIKVMNSRFDQIIVQQQMFPKMR